MQPESQPGIHVSYCSNIHPGESWSETFSQLKNHVPELSSRLASGKPFGIGLRLSAQAAVELSQQEKLNEFKNWLKTENLYVFTINGFPYGNFHGSRVKDDVYKPDWRNEKRFAYTSTLIDLMAALLPDGGEGSISTSPVSYKYWADIDPIRDEVFEQAAIFFARLAHKMAQIKQVENKDIHVDIEPEPDCLIENSRETIRFFNDYLIPAGTNTLAREAGLDNQAAKQVLLSHIGVCYDTCHFALEYEEASDAIRNLQQAGIRIGKVQISSALRVELGDEQQRRKTAEQLRRFDEPVYLHQVIEKRSDGSLKQYRDLPEALSHIMDEDAKEWRIHFHVPLFVDEYGSLHSTQQQTRESLAVMIPANASRHYEVETYTWDVLPPDLKAYLTDSIEREMRWALDTIRDISVKNTGR